jgi:hypothetical protein
MPSKRIVFAIGALARVFKGELRGSTVGLTEYLKPDIKVLQSLLCRHDHGLISFPIGLLSRSIDVAVPETQVCASVFRNL